MGKGKPRAVEKGVLRQNLGASSSSCVNIPSGPVYYPTEEEFKDPLQYIYKIRPEAEPYGICRIVPPSSWKPPFALDLNSFTFPTKSQAIHQLQARPASCDSKTFELEYNSFLEGHCGKKARKRVVFEDEDLDLCKLFNAVKRYGGYDKVVKKKKWGEVFRILQPDGKVSECAKHVLSQLYREHLYDYETYHNRLNKGKTTKSCKRRIQGVPKSENSGKSRGSKKRRKNNSSEKVKLFTIEEDNERLDQVCEQCKSGLHEDVMLLCDRCNKGWHIYCLSPPLKQVPLGNWYCFGCLNSNKDCFGFIPGKELSLEAFRRVADRTKKKWFGSGPLTKVQVEKKFWQIVEGAAGDVEVMYGSDVDTSVYGSGFPRIADQRPESIERSIWDEYCSTPWNLNNLPKLEGSMLRKVHNNIAGVMVPWLYVGMLFSAFCWHYEDHCFYSMNYLHWGEPKCWYSVPGSACNAFEKVMRKTLPDLFDAQPDLLFQLVTMLNPSVLQQNGVPVYNVVQEPGNFVITFPRSFHSGFNFGLNCAEAVNFAPADWIPHGGFSAELYRLYRKPAILSHEELLYVAAKSICDGEESPFLKKELLKIYNKEKTWRERLWRSGVVKSSPMAPKKYPEFVGTEEDPVCRICQQYLFLSAVVCRCRPSAFVCLEHWDHICECKPSRHRLLYRHTLAELKNLGMIEKDGNAGGNCRSSLIQNSSPSEMSALSKKVKGVTVTFTQLAEQWLLDSSKIIQDPFSKDTYRRALKEAEQFLWAGSEMDPVRNMEKRLSEGQHWAESVSRCLHRIVNWSYDLRNETEKVDLEMVDKLLTLNPSPCNEPGHLRLKEYAEEARRLVDEINCALSLCSEISELEAIWSRSCKFPILVRESEKLNERLSSSKAWIERVRICTSERHPGAIEIDDLYKLKLQISELQVSLPEAMKLLDLVKKADSCRASCRDLLKGPMAMKDVEIVIQEMDGFPVTIPELQLLRQYHADTVSLISRFNKIRDNVHERVDQDAVAVELNSILNQGTLLKIQVEELPVVELELKKACCRGKALKARSDKMSLAFLQQVIAEAIMLQIEGEELFVHIEGMVKAAILWEESAGRILAREAPILEFEEVMRYSEGINATLPSAGDVLDAITTAKTWLKNSKVFLDYASSSMRFSSTGLKVVDLKELVAQSKSLKIYLEERKTVETILKKFEEWEMGAGSLLQCSECLFDMSDFGPAVAEAVLCKIECLLKSADAEIADGLSLGMDFPEMPKLLSARSKLQWCHDVLSLSSRCPSLQEVKRLMEFSEDIPVTRASGALCSSLLDGMKWVKRAVEVVCAPLTYRNCSLRDAEEILSESQRICVSFPMVVGLLKNAIQNHKLWKEQVNQFFSKATSDRMWSELLELKDKGKDAAFSCSELDIILSEFEKVEKWKHNFMDIGCSSGNPCSSLDVVDKIVITLDRSLNIYAKSKGRRMQNLCVSCSSACTDSASLECNSCNDCYHLQCLRPAIGNEKQLEVFMCRFCRVFRGDWISPIEEGLLLAEGNRFDLNFLDELLSKAEDLCVWVDERGPLRDLLERAHSCKAGLIEILDFLSSYTGEDLNIISEKLSVALKAVEVSVVLDRESNHRLELALASYSWRVRVGNLCGGPQKPSIQQIQLLLKEGGAINIPPEDSFRRKLVALKEIGLQWANIANKVVRDDGATGLDEVFKLIEEGESLPVSMEKELKRLRSRSELYCICRKPYGGSNQQVWIACDQCNEWYHINCVKLTSVPKFYICPACKPPLGDWEYSEEKTSHHEISTHNRPEEPKTPSPKLRSSNEKAKRTGSTVEKDLSVAAKKRKRISSFDGIELLWWRNRKPFRRSAKKRVDLGRFAAFLHSENNSETLELENNEGRQISFPTTSLTSNTSIYNLLDKVRPNSDTIRSCWFRKPDRLSLFKIIPNPYKLPFKARKLVLRFGGTLVVP